MSYPNPSGGRGPKQKPEEKPEENPPEQKLQEATESIAGQLKKHWSHVSLVVLATALCVALVGPAAVAAMLLAASSTIAWCAGAVVLGLILWVLGSKAAWLLRRLAKRHGFTPAILLLLPITSVSIWFTFTVPALIGLSGHASAAGAILLWTVSVALFNKYPSRDVSFFKEMADGNVAAAIGFSAIAFCLALLILAALSIVTL